MEVFVMRSIKIIRKISLAIASILLLNGCTKNLENININPNLPEIVPTNTIFNGANKFLLSNTRDGWWQMRMSMPWMQYSAQNNYIEEDKYLYRDAQGNNGWNYLYRAANNYQDIIKQCEDPVLSKQMSVYGNLANQIAVSRIMLAYVFDNLVTHFGAVPYWSYGQPDNPDFQALDIEKTITAVYVSEEVIYKDLLKELKEAVAQLNLDEVVFTSSDNIYRGDAASWKKFANSLRLRIANRVKEVIPEAKAEIKDAINSGVFTSNADNAIHAFGKTNADANPFWRLFYVDNRTDYWVNRSFIQLLVGAKGNFGFDPRLYKVAAPKGLIFKDYTRIGYTDSEDMNDYTGLPYGLPKVEAYYQQAVNINIFSKDFLKVDRGEVLMEYAEVEFILSELNGWAQDSYVRAVVANMERLEVPSVSIAKFVGALPSANEKNVLTQKYVSLMYVPDEAWNEYRRTGYPDGDILLLPGATGVRPHDGSTYIFTPLKSGNVVATDLPARIRYPSTQQTLNPINWRAAVAKLGGDEIDKKLLFAKK